MPLLSGGSRRRLILGEEEEPLPDIPEAQRAPYVSPTLVQVTAPEGVPTSPPAAAAARMVGPSGSAPVDAGVRSGAEASAAPEQQIADQTLATIDLTSDAPPPSADAHAHAGASSMDDIMAQARERPASYASSCQPIRANRPHRWPGWRSRACSWRRRP